MSRYRKIEVRMWSDRKFCSLSRPQPSGQALWLFLLTGPHTGPIPGLFRASRGQMADELDWDLEGFDKAFQEVLNEGMAKVDLKAKLVWLPNALRLNKPESPNVVKSWAAEWELLPECSLKDEAEAHIIKQLSEFGESFASAFFDVIGKNYNDLEPSSKPSSKPSGKPCPNQEQEQEQQQDTTALSAREGFQEIPTDATQWAAFFVNVHGFQIHEAQTARSIPMFVDWVSRKISISDVDAAVIAGNNWLISQGRTGPPDNPCLYGKFLETVLANKGKNNAKPSTTKTKQHQVDPGFAEKYSELFDQTAQR